MEALCVSNLPSCASQAGVTVSRLVNGASNLGRPTTCVKQTRLACRSSSYMLGTLDVALFFLSGSTKPSRIFCRDSKWVKITNVCDQSKLKVQRRGVRTIVSRGPRCEATESGGQNSKVDVWIGRFAMLGFVTAIGTEITSGKGVLANLGISTPAPTLALTLTAVVGLVLAFGVFRSASEE